MTLVASFKPPTLFAKSFNFKRRGKVQKRKKTVPSKNEKRYNPFSTLCDEFPETNKIDVTALQWMVDLVIVILSQRRSFGITLQLKLGTCVILLILFDQQIPMHASNKLY